MTRPNSILAALHGNEEGHATPAIATVIGSAGAILLGIGAANDNGGLAIAGGIIAGLGVLAAGVLHHREVDYDVYRRIEALEKKA